MSLVSKKRTSPQSTYRESATILY